MKPRTVRPPFINPRLLLAFFIGCGVGFSLYPSFQESWIASLQEEASINVCFSPEGQCTNGIVEAIEHAQKSILVMAYSFTSRQIAEALIEAHQRGIVVKILIDKSQIRNKHSYLPLLAEQGLPIFIDSVRGIAHNKVMIFDERYVLTGSFNWTQAADSRNAENVLLINDPSLAEIYKENWERRAQAAKTYS